jgi:hypothetical protein
VPVGDQANHICAYIEIGGAFSPEECHETLAKVVDRHEALRVSFLPGKDRTLEMVRVTAAPQFSFRELTVAESEPESLEEVLKEYLKAEGRRSSTAKYKARLEKFLESK